MGGADSAALVLFEDVTYPALLQLLLEVTTLYRKSAEGNTSPPAVHRQFTVQFSPASPGFALKQIRTKQRFVSLPLQQICRTAQQSVDNSLKLQLHSSPELVC